MASIHRLVVIIGLLGLAGCGSKATRIELTTYDAQGVPERRYTEFQQASYSRAQDGMLELVLRSDRPSSVDPTQNITQIVYIKTFWNPEPGTTYADATQINARIQYAMLTPPTGIRYDGGGFVHAKMNKRTGEMVGTIEGGSLRPRYRLGNASDPFGPCRIAGTFRAKENARVVVDTQQMLKTQFNP